MNIRPKTKRRLIILVVGFMLVCSVVGGVFYLQRSKFKAKLRADRLAGMDAYHAGDYLTALKHLSNYVSKQKQDLDALFAYGMARANVEEPNRSHIREGINVFRALLDRDPNNLQAKKMLLDLWVKNRYDVEARGLAEELLQSNPDDLDGRPAPYLASVSPAPQTGG